MKEKSCTGEVAHQARQPKKPVRELPPQCLCRWLIIDALVPDLQRGGDAHRPEEHEHGPDDAQSRHCVTPRGHQRVDVSGRPLIETEAGDQGVSRVPSALGGNGDQEGKQAHHRERGELQGAVHEVDGVELGPEGSRRGGPHPVECVGPLLQQPPFPLQQPQLAIAERLSPPRACPRGILRE
jgi:hypothetical protein